MMMMMYAYSCKKPEKAMAVMEQYRKIWKFKHISLRIKNTERVWLAYF